MFYSAIYVTPFYSRKIYFFLVLMIFISGCEEKVNVPASATPENYRARVINPNYSGGMIEPQTGAALIWGSDGSILRSQDGVEWTYAHTPLTTAITQISADNEGSFLIAIGAQGSILRSINNGQTWKAIRTDSNADLKALLCSPAKIYCFAGGSAGTLLRSTDQGLSWNNVELGKGLNLLDIESLFRIPATGRLLLGGTKGLLGFSDDNGLTWQFTQLDIDTPLSHFYMLNDILIATSAYGKILVSADKGAAWQLIETDGQAFFNDATYDPIRRTILLVSHSGKVLRSADNGVTWQLGNAPYHGVNNYLSTVAFDEQQKIVRAFGHYGTHLISHDGGMHWEEQTAEPRVPFENILPLGKSGVYIGYGRGGLLASSFDYGRNWKTHLVQTDVYLREVLATPKGNWLAVGELGFILRSQDQGGTWQFINVAYSDPMTPPTYRALIIEPKTQAVIAAGPTGTIMRSADEGATWVTVHYTAFEQAEAFTDLLVDTFHQRLIAIEADGRHYISEDGGLSWRPAFIETQRKFWHGSILSQKDKSTLIVTGQGGVAGRSLDGGLSWTLINSGTEVDLFGSYADQKHQQLFLVGAAGTLLRSQDHGESWQIMPTTIDSDLRRMIADPKTGALLAFGGDGKIIRSTDAGTSWQVVASNSDQELRAAVIEPATQDILVTGRDGKIIRSHDSGLTWIDLNTHTNSHFRSLAVDSSTGAIIAVGERIVQLAPQK